MNQEKGLGLQSQCPFFKKCLGLQCQAIFGLFLSKNVDREMGQICNISFWPLFTIKLGKNAKKWQNLQRQTSPQTYKGCVYTYIQKCWWHQEWPYFYRLRVQEWAPFVQVFTGQLFPGPPHACICSLSRVSWFCQFSEAFSQTVVRWSWTSAKISVSANHSPSNCRRDFGQVLVEKLNLYFWGWSAFWGARFSLDCFHVWRSISQVGVMKTVCFGKCQNRMELRRLFFGVAHGFPAFGKIHPDTLFCSFIPRLPMVGCGGVLGTKPVCCLVPAKGVAKNWLTSCCEMDPKIGFCNPPLGTPPPPMQITCTLKNVRLENHK